MNLTHNSVAKCEETVCFTKEVSTVRAFAEHFDWLWAQSETVDSQSLRVAMTERQVAQQSRSHSK